MDLVTSSYISSLSAVVHSQRRRNSSADFHMLAVNMSDDGLPFAEEEMQVIRSQPVKDRAVILSNAEATVDRVLVSLEQINWIHMACHATQDHVLPMMSAFQLFDGPLSLEEISRNYILDGDLAVLLACESGQGSALLPDEGLHLAGGLQFLGFRSVIATLWQINDVDGPIVAEKVYEHLFRHWPDQPNSSEAAYALRRAVIHLRDELGRPPSSWVPLVHLGT
jgi:CHAT domain-containing protein